ncbi:MAG: aminoglycoside phosphotransferase family protein [Actinomycetota bacterium]
MNAYDVAVRIAGGDRFQDLTRPTKALAKNHHYRIWRDGSSVLLKVYGTAARERRESHAIEALRGIPGIPVKLDGDSEGELPWALFEDPGQWSIGSLPGNPDAALRAGAVLRAVHESDPTRLSNLSRGIDAEWVDIDHAATMRRLARYRRRLGIDAELYAAAAAVRPPEASEPRAAHTDPTPEHFVIAEAGPVTLIDWEWATLAPPEWDLSKAVWLLRARSDPVAAQALQEGYGSTLDPTQMNRWVVYHAAMLLVYEAEQLMSDSGADSFADTVAQLRMAVEAEAEQ